MLRLKRARVVVAGPGDAPEQRLSIEIEGGPRRSAVADVGLVGAAQASSSANVTSSIDSSAATLTRSVGSWLRSVPLARFVTGRPWASRAFASDPPPVTMRLGA